MVNPRNNKLLARLSDSTYERILPELRLVSLVAGEELHGPGDPIERVYFPISALICLSKQLSDGLSMDTAQIGAESMAGLRGVTGPSAHLVYVAITGLAYQMSISVLKHELKLGSEFRQIGWQVANNLSRMMVLQTTCGHFHTIEQRLAKWILSRGDRLNPAPIPATHQSVADALGVRREAVTIALGKLPGIHCQRGFIELKDRTAVQAVSCDCYHSECELIGTQMQFTCGADAAPSH